MPVPSNILELSSTPAANSPQGTESAKGTIDDYFRSHAAFIAQLNGLIAGATVTLASNSSVAIGAAASLNVAITGTSTIVSFDTVPDGITRWVNFTGALTLTHNATSLLLPGAANIATAPGDVALFKSLGGGNWKCMSYQPAAGVPTIASLVAALAGKTIPGDLSIGGQLLLKDGSAASPSLSFVTESGTDTGFFHLGEGVIGLTSNGVQMATISSAGIVATKITQNQP
jgi:hypothetical protein